MRAPAINKCRKCGKPIGIITWGIYRKEIVDAEAVMVVPDPEGEQFLRMDGSKVQAREADYEIDYAEPAYRPHRKTCGMKE